MIRLKDLFRLQRIHNLRLIAGQAGLDRAVRAAVLFEYDASRMMLNDFYRGDLVVTTLAYAREDESLVASSLLSLMKQGVAGLMVKTGYYDALPAAVTEAADREGVPLFLFDDTYIEEAILEVAELIRGQQHFPGYEKDLDELMGGNLSRDEIREKMRRIDPYGGESRIYALFAGSQLHSVSDRLSLLDGAVLRREKCVFMSWHQGLFVLLHPLQGDGTDFGQIDSLLEEAGVAPEDVVIGAGERYALPEEAGGSLCEAVYAVRAALAKGVRRMSAGEMGLYAWLLPMSENAFIRSRCRKVMDRLREYDRRNKTNLEQTAQEYLRCGLEIAPTAKVLYQHPNTVRYRLGKIRRMMDIGEGESFELLLSLMIRLSDLLEHENR